MKKMVGCQSFGNSFRTISVRPKAVSRIRVEFGIYNERQDMDVIGKAKYAFNEALIITKICHSLRALGATGKR